MRSSPFLLTGILFLSSCAGGGGAETRLKHEAVPESLTTTIALRVLESTGQVRKIGVVVLNPAAVPVQSIRAWVHFDPSQMRAHTLAIADGRFVLFAPGEREIDPMLGFVKIGGAVREPIRDTEILLATFTVQASPSREAERPVLAFYDWQAEGAGHTAVLSLGEQQYVTNTVRAPSSLDL